MENQELPKKLTLEEIEQEKKNLEQKDENIAKTSEKEAPVLLSDINEKIENKNQTIEDTKNKINEIRNRMGLPSSDEISPSVKIEQEAIQKLNQEKTNLENNIQNPEMNQESQNESSKFFERNLRNIIDDISTKSKTMLDALYERQQQQFTPLQNPDEFQGVVSHLKNIKNFDGKFDINGLDQIIENIQKVSRLIENMNPKQAGQVRENPQNLEKLAYGAKTFSASLDEAGRNLGPDIANEKIEEKRKELRKSLGVLSEQTQKLSSLASRMRFSLH